MIPRLFLDRQHDDKTTCGSQLVERDIERAEGKSTVGDTALTDVEPSLPGEGPDTLASVEDDAFNGGVIDAPGSPTPPNFEDTNTSECQSHVNGNQASANGNSALDSASSIRPSGRRNSGRRDRGDRHYPKVKPRRESKADRNADVGKILSEESEGAISSSKINNDASMWAGENESIPLDLTDEERLRLLRYVRPAVFGTHCANRPRSAPGGIMSSWRTRRFTKLPSAASTRGKMPAHKQYEPTGGIYLDGVLAHRRQAEDYRGDGNRRRGILTQNTFPGEGDPHAREHMRSKRGGGGERGVHWSNVDGFGQARSFVQSVAFEVNMGILQSLSCTATSNAASAATAGCSERGVKSPSCTTPPPAAAEIMWTRRAGQQYRRGGGRSMCSSRPRVGDVVDLLENTQQKK